MSGVYLLFRFILIYRVVHQTGWLLRTLLILSLSILILAVQPYKKSYMNLLDGLLLALMGFLTLLIVTFLYIQSSSSESLSLMFVVACAWCSTACLGVECHLQTTERKTDGTIYCRQS